MEKKKTNLMIIFVAFFIVILFILAAYKNMNSHYEKELLVVNNKILESAKNCYLEKKCEGEITLKDLYDKKYIEKQIDPRTKTDYNENVCIKWENKKAVFCK